MYESSKTDEYLQGMRLTLEHIDVCTVLYSMYIRVQCSVVIPMHVAASLPTLLLLLLL
jgi:hypothetical protein